MPWLVVEGKGSWSPDLGREWVADETRAVPYGAPLDDEGNPQRGHFRARGKVYKAGAHRVTKQIATLAESTGYPWLIVMADEDGAPEVVEADLSGTLQLSDLKEAKGAGVRVKPSKAVIEEAPENEEEPVFEHKCRWCSTIPARTFPSTGSLERHIEFEHPMRHALGEDRALEAAAAVEREREELRRISDHDKPVPVWDREALERAGLPPAPEPDPTIPT